MKSAILSVTAFAAAFQLAQTPAQGTRIGGPPGEASGPGWQSSFVDIDPPRDFKKGDRLRIKIDGNAQWVRVRLLPTPAGPTSSAGLIGQRLRVPSGGLLDIVLTENHPAVKQVSVHAGERAWDEELNADGGKAKIASVYVSPK